MNRGRFLSWHGDFGWCGEHSDGHNSHTKGKKQEADHTPSTETIKQSDYVNDLDPYGWGLGFRTLIDPLKNNNLGSKGEFGWAGAAATYFLIDLKKEISAILMTQALNGDPSLKNNFYKFIYTNF